MKETRCIYVELKRLFCSERTWIVFAFMTILTMLCFFSVGDFNSGNSPLSIVITAVADFLYLFIFVMAFFLHGDTFISDFEHSYIRQQMCRVTLKRYVVTRTLTAYIISVFSVALSLWLASVLLGFFKPWGRGGGASDLLKTALADLYSSNHHLTYVFVMGLVWGLLTGMLVMLSMLLSVFIPDRTICAISTVLFSLILQYLWNIIDAKGVTFLTYFYPPNWFVRWGFGWTIKCTVISLLFVVLCTYGIYLRLKRRLEYE